MYVCMHVCGCMDVWMYGCIISIGFSVWAHFDILTHFETPKNEEKYNIGQICQKVARSGLFGPSVRRVLGTGQNRKKYHLKKKTNSLRSISIVWPFLAPRPECNQNSHVCMYVRGYCVHQSLEPPVTVTPNIHTYMGILVAFWAWCQKRSNYGNWP
jgi:hypothetical protein